MTTRFTAVALLAVGLLAAVPVSAEVIGKADTAFKLIGRNHQVVVEASPVLSAWRARAG